MNTQAQIETFSEVALESAAFIKMKTEARALAAKANKGADAFASFAWRVVDAARTSDLTADEAAAVIREYVFAVYPKEGTRKAYMSRVRAVLAADPAGDAEAKAKGDVFAYGAALAKAERKAEKAAEAAAKAKAEADAEMEIIVNEAIRIADGAPVTAETLDAARASLEERLRSEAAEAAKANALAALRAAAAAAMVAGVPIEDAAAAFGDGYTV